MRLPLLLAAAFLSVPAFAETYTSTDDFHFSLSRGALTNATDGDLHVSAVGVYAAYGARRGSREGEFQSREVLVLEERYDIRDASGGVWKMWVRMSPNRMIEIELVRAGPEESRR